MRYAHVALGLPVDRLFDYELPEGCRDNAVEGCRVKVNFRGKKHTGYIVGGSEQSDFPAIKPVLALVDEKPVLSPHMIALTRELSRYYCCSWGEMIETALPERVRKGAALDPVELASCAAEHHAAPLPVVVRDTDVVRRWDRYYAAVETALAAKRQAIILLPDTGAITHCCARLRKRFPGIPSGILFRKQPAELSQWQKVRAGEYPIIVGTRSAVFAPVPRLGAIIVEDEHDYGYKQDQVPHYHARIAAITRARIEAAPAIFGSAAPSLEMIRMCREGGAQLSTVSSVAHPEIKVIDTTRLPYGTRSRLTVSKYAQDAIVSTTAAGGKTLVFINRRGFATTAVCASCGTYLNCPRCATHLAFHFRAQTLSCSYCGFTMKPPKLCPACSSGYIKFSGTGTEKVESDLARLFPSARISSVARETPLDTSSADLFVATQAVLANAESRFDLTIVLSLDNSLNHADFRATEKAFSLITGLAALTTHKMVIQTTVPSHYAVRALEADDPDGFYDKELSLREQLLFPPARHFALVKCRGRSADKVRAAAEEISSLLTRAHRDTAVPISTTPGQPPQLRDSHYWNVLVAGDDAEKMSGDIKICLKDFRRSGIIVTVDVDPV